MSEQLRRTTDLIAQSRDIEQLRAAIAQQAPALGLGYVEGDAYARQAYRYAIVSLAAPIPALELCRALGWQRAYAVSTDVHQTMWSLMVWAQDLQDPYGARIHAVYPQLGEWRVLARLAGRPRGDLPGVSAGASPAYDLERYEASVTQLELRPSAFFGS